MAVQKDQKPSWQLVKNTSFSFVLAHVQFLWNHYYCCLVKSCIFGSPHLGLWKLNLNGLHKDVSWTRGEIKGIYTLKTVANCSLMLESDFGKLIYRPLVKDLTSLWLLSILFFFSFSWGGGGRGIWGSLVHALSSQLGRCAIIVRWCYIWDKE